MQMQQGAVRAPCGETQHRDQLGTTPSQGRRQVCGEEIGLRTMWEVNSLAGSGPASVARARHRCLSTSKFSGIRSN